jgi:hypothetical protein
LAISAEDLAHAPRAADALAQDPNCPAAEVTRVAGQLTAAGIQAVLDQMDRFVSEPDLLAQLAVSPAASAEQRALLGELNGGAFAAADVVDELVDEEADFGQRQTLAQRVATMNVVERLTLALKGGRTERMLLIRDPNKLVQKCVLQSPRLTDSEVEGFACMTNLSAEILRMISMNRLFMKNYAIVKNLVNNPKTPLDTSLHLFPRLTATDLVKLTTNKNVPETLRSSAVKLHRKRKMGG